MLAANPSWVVFDAADTLLRPHPPVAAVYQACAHRHGVHISVEEISQRLPAAMRQHFAAPCSSEHDEQDRWRALVADVLATRKERLFTELWEHFARPNSWQLFEDVHETWDWLDQRKYRLAIASNFDQRLRAIVASTPPLDRAQHLFLSSQLGFRKPSAGFFRAIEGQLQESPRRLLLVGDHPRADLQGAQQAGWQALQVDRHSNQVRFPRIRRLTDVIPLLEQAAALAS